MADTRTSCATAIVDSCRHRRRIVDIITSGDSFLEFDASTDSDISRVFPARGRTSWHRRDIISEIASLGPGPLKMSMRPRKGPIWNSWTLIVVVMVAWFHICESRDTVAAAFVGVTMTTTDVVVVQQVSNDPDSTSSDAKQVTNITGTNVPDLEITNGRFSSGDRESEGISEVIPSSDKHVEVKRAAPSTLISMLVTKATVKEKVLLRSRRTFDLSGACPPTAGGYPQFSCPLSRDGNICISDQQLCNGRFDCPGPHHEDENPVTCFFYKFVTSQMRSLTRSGAASRGRSY